MKALYRSHFSHSGVCPLISRTVKYPYLIISDRPQKTRHPRNPQAPTAPRPSSPTICSGKGTMTVQTTRFFPTTCRAVVSGDDLTRPVAACTTSRMASDWVPLRRGDRSSWYKPCRRPCVERVGESERVRKTRYDHSPKDTAL